MPESALLSSNAADALSIAAVIATEPTTAADGAAFPNVAGGVAGGPWLIGSRAQRRAMLVLIPSVGATTLAGIGLWIYVGATWWKLPLVVIPDQTFTGGKPFGFVLDWITLGSRFTVTGTPGVGTVSAKLYPIETYTE